MMDVLKLPVPIVLLLQDFSCLDYAFLYANGLVGGIRRNFRAYRFAIGSDDADVCKSSTKC
jgi:hypothetical protein